LPTLNLNITQACLDAATINFNQIKKIKRARVVVIGINWDHSKLLDRSGKVYDNADNSVLIKAVNELTIQLKKIGKDVILIGPLAYPGWNVASILSRQYAFGYSIDRQLFYPSTQFYKKYDSVLWYFENSDLVFIRPDRVQCINTRCEYLLEGNSLFSDDNHIAQAELYRFSDLFENGLISALKSK
jgi:hypothetical protein